MKKPWVALVILLLAVLVLVGSLVSCSGGPAPEGSPDASRYQSQWTDEVLAYAIAGGVILLTALLFALFKGPGGS
jgi:hypothetical protein